MKDGLVSNSRLIFLPFGTMFVLLLGRVAMCSNVLALGNYRIPAC